MTNKHMFIHKHVFELINDSNFIYNKPLFGSIMLFQDINIQTGIVKVQKSYL